eukprot:CAMPEP_0177766316 /NCGR_PEP_ID=MMETSP0491_2-20121128/8462_1 /TAXON_ID=63592 /ORGANISM="Tetraselmis chuii, Strain PLY429" /LENGTH=373 /DNA_ID=CAMNT_0019282727 /DNA_START=285 /DNA_END=1402 /DNA_ORIENTATION=+
MTNPEVPHSSHPPPNAAMTIHLAAWHGDRAKVEYFVREKEDLGYPAMETLQARDGVTGDTPLHKAVENEQTELVKWLLEQGVMPNVKDNSGVTPLHLASIKGYVTLVQLLLDSDSTVKKVTDANGDTAVHWACTKGHLEVLDLLLSRGAALDVANKQGWTALHRSAYNGRPEVLERLLNAGASLHAVNQDGNTALHLAAHNNHLAAISLLLKWGAKTDMRNNEGLIPALCGQVPGVRSMIEDWEVTHPPKHKKVPIAGGSGAGDKTLSPAKPGSPRLAAASSPRKLSSRERSVTPDASPLAPTEAAVAMMDAASEAAATDVKPSAASVTTVQSSRAHTPRMSDVSRTSHRSHAGMPAGLKGINPTPLRSAASS